MLRVVLDLYNNYLNPIRRRVQYSCQEISPLTFYYFVDKWTGNERNNFLASEY